MIWHTKCQHICDIHLTTCFKSGDKSERDWIEVDVPNSVAYLLRTPVFECLSGMWFGVSPKMDIIKTWVLRKLDCALKLRQPL